MKSTINLTVTMAGETSTTSQTRTEDGVAGVTPTCTPAAAGTLTTRSSASAGVITVIDTDVVTGDLAILTWVDALGVLKHRYNVACSDVTETSDSGSDDVDVTYEVTFTGGAGDDLPDQDEDINISHQTACNVTFDFDDIDTFLVSTNVRGVVVLLDALDTEKCVIDMNTKGVALWLEDSGFPAPISGTPVTHVLVGSGDTSTTSFMPKIIGLYDASVSGS